MSAAPLALVTGGGRRLGGAIAVALAAAGYRLAVANRSGEAPQGLPVDADCAAFAADLSEAGAPERVIAEVVARCGDLPDLLVNAAARFGQAGWETTDRAGLAEEFALNLFAPVELTLALVRASGEARQPAVVHIVDQRVTNPNRDQFAYTLSKQALAASIRSLAVALGARVRVNGVAPGLILANPGFDASHMERVAAAMPLARNATAADIADAVLYLARARAVTGQLLFVDGGAHLKSFDRDFEHF